MRNIAVALLLLLSSNFIETTRVSADEPGFQVQQAQNMIKIGVNRFVLDDESGELSGPSPPGATTDVLNTTSLAISYSRWLAPQWSVEIMGGAPPRFEFQGGGSTASLGKTGSTVALNPAVLLEFHFFDPTSAIRPYIGVGLNYTKFINEESSNALAVALGGNTRVKLNDFVAPVVSAGIDANIEGPWLLSLSATYAKADTTATLTTAGIDRVVDVRLDPLVLFVGLGYQF